MTAMRRRSTGAERARDRSERMYLELRERICLLLYPPGQVLGEQALAEEFGVSRTPIRKVLGRLEGEGLVESRHGVGTVVTVIDPVELAQVYALRMRLAELMGELDPRRPSAEEFDRLRALLHRCDQLRALPDGPEFCRVNMAFNEALIALIGNSALREVTERLYYRTSRFFLHALPAMDFAQEIEIFRQEMIEIIAALERGDFRGAAFHRRNHIAHSLHRMTGGRATLALQAGDPARAPDPSGRA